VVQEEQGRNPLSEIKLTWDEFPGLSCQDKEPTDFLFASSSKCHDGSNLREELLDHELVSIKRRLGSTGDGWEIDDLRQGILTLDSFFTFPEHDFKYSLHQRNRTPLRSPG
jgi:hypothetical protein